MSKRTHDSSAPDALETTTAEQPAAAEPAPKDYTRARAAYDAAFQHYADLGVQPTGPAFATDMRAPGMWERQNHQLHDFWFTVAEAVLAAS